MQTDERLDTFLAHYGVKGMKWGVTRNQIRGALGQRTAPVGKPSAEAKATAKVHAKAKTQKSVQSLSNKELKDAIERMRLEQQYSQMTGGIDKTAQQKASSFISGVVQKSAKEATANLVTAQVRSTLPNGSQQQKKPPNQGANS